MDVRFRERRTETSYSLEKVTLYVFSHTDGVCFRMGSV